MASPVPSQLNMIWAMCSCSKACSRLNLEIRSNGNFAILNGIFSDRSSKCDKFLAKRKHIFVVYASIVCFFIIHKVNWVSWGINCMKISRFESPINQLIVRSNLLRSLICMIPWLEFRSGKWNSTLLGLIESTLLNNRDWFAFKILCATLDSVSHCVSANQFFHLIYVLTNDIAASMNFNAKHQDKNVWICKYANPWNEEKKNYFN